MIKYPVIVVADSCCVEIEESIYYPGFIVRDADDHWLLSLESEEDANTIANALNTMNELKTSTPKPYLVRYKGKKGIYPVIEEDSDEICILRDFLYEPTPKIRALKIWQNKNLFEIVVP